MEQLSPFTRRFVAIGLLIVVAISIVNLVIAPVIVALPATLARLGDIRFERAQSEAIAARPSSPPASPLDQGLYIKGSKPEVAGSALTDLLRRLAAESGVSLTRADANALSSGSSTLAEMSFSAKGPEEALITFLNKLETGRPVVRLRDWRIAIDDKGAIHLDGHAAAAWGAR